MNEKMYVISAKYEKNIHIRKTMSAKNIFSLITIRYCYRNYFPTSKFTFSAINVVFYRLVLHCSK